MNSPTSVDDDPSPPPFHPTCVQTPSSKKPASLHKPDSQKAERPVVQFGASNGGCFALHTRAGWGFGPPSDRPHTMNKHETTVTGNPLKTKEIKALLEEDGLTLPFDMYVRTLVVSSSRSHYPI